MFIPVVLGTARKGRKSEAVANAVVEHMKTTGVETILVDVNAYPLRATDNSEKNRYAKKWEKILNKADGIIIVSPEYNHGYPGELKLFLDQLYDQYEKKVFGICSVSDGPWGGTRMTEQLRQVIVALKAIPLQRAVHVSEVNNFKPEHIKTQVQGLLEQMKEFIS
ncbi:NADPH-dependent FMN reductase [archaeon CG10_big_fil_rev_8_21_14_0_10_43_11]|nr:MAG: NADPH-dependent FMN reductase [archaeon CG10_big_fil_rev_8_21_14_0_10_43_11]